MGNEGRGCWRTTAQDGRCYRRSKVKHTSCVFVGLALCLLTGGENRPICCNFLEILRNCIQLPLEDVCALNFRSNCLSSCLPLSVLTGSDAFVSSSLRGMVSSIENGGRAQHTDAQRVRGGLGLRCIASGETLGLKVRDAFTHLESVVHARAHTQTNKSVT